MPIKFSDLARDTKAGTLDLDDGGDDGGDDGSGTVIHFRFRHGLITPRLMHDLLTLNPAALKSATPAEQEAAIMAVCEQVARIVTEWDVLEADGVTMFPLDVARLAADIPLLTQAHLLHACLEEMLPGESKAPGDNGSANGRASGAISSRTGRSARSRNGTR